MTSQDTTSAIFLPGLDFGLWPCDGLDSKAGPASGQEVVLASHSVVPAQEKERQTNATCGQSSATSSGPADPELSSESRLPAPQLSDMLGLALQRRLARYGSMEYEQTWKLRVTPSGLRYWAHTASGHRTSGSGVTGSPTPRGIDGSKGQRTMEGVNAELDRKGNLDELPMLCGHPTPACNEPDGAFRPSRAATGRTTDYLGRTAQLAGHPTCSARDWKDTPGMAQTGTNPDGSERRRLDMLPRVAALAGHATPRSTAPKCGGEYTENCTGKDLAKDATMAGQPLGAATASTATSTAKTVGYRLNPGFSLWLMIGIPTIVDVWASCGVLAMQSCRRSRRSS